jgi:hypothetical protein
MNMPHDLLMMAHDVVLMWNLESREVANPSLAGGGAKWQKMIASHHRALVAFCQSYCTYSFSTTVLCVSLPHLCFHVIMDARPPPAAPPLSREGQLAALQQQQAQLQGELLRQQQQQAAQLQANSHLKSLPIRAYLDQTVVPILLDGMFIKNH